MFDDDEHGKPSKALTPLQRRLIEGADVALGDPESILYQHSVFCQTSLPYRNPGDDVRTWERVNGKAHLEISAGKAMHPELERLVPIGLPYGPKPRLILAHMNAEAIRTEKPVIEVETSLSAFARRLGLHREGRTIATLKDQLARVAAARITLGVMEDGRAITIDSKIVTAFDLWLTKDDRQRVLWPSTVQLSADYFNSLVRHAVPLSEDAIRRLAGSAMGLDVYGWLAQRLHRIKPSAPAFITWAALKGQFGWHYKRMNDFKTEFRQTLRQVLTVYPAARVELDDRGMTLWHSAPPVRKFIGWTLPNTGDR